MAPTVDNAVPSERFDGEWTASVLTPAVTKQLIVLTVYSHKILFFFLTLCRPLSLWY